MRILELFSGTGSVGRQFAALGYDVVAVDLDRKANPTHLADILTWDYKQYPPGHFDHVHASPPCTEYSIAKTCGVRDFAKADSIVERTLAILVYFDPPCWSIENPYVGLRSRPCMELMNPYLRVISYCKYGMPYRKHTCIWSNLYEHWQPEPHCSKDSPCAHMAAGAKKHPLAAQARNKVGDEREIRFTQRELYVIPAVLCQELAEASMRRLLALR